MKKVTIPEGYQRVMPYLIVKDAAGLLHFMEQVLGAREKSRQLRDDSAIMHAEVSIGDSTIMCADSTDQWPAVTAGLYVYVADTDEAYTKALALGATSLMESEDKDYGRAAGVTDPYGNVWWLTEAAIKKTE